MTGCHNMVMSRHVTRDRHTPIIVTSWTPSNLAPLGPSPASCAEICILCWLVQRILITLFSHGQSGAGWHWDAHMLQGDSKCQDVSEAIFSDLFFEIEGMKLARKLFRPNNLCPLSTLFGSSAVGLFNQVFYPLTLLDFFWRYPHILVSTLCQWPQSLANCLLANYRPLAPHRPGLIKYHQLSPRPGQGILDYPSE